MRNYWFISVIKHRLLKQRVSFPLQRSKICSIRD